MQQTPRAIVVKCDGSVYDVDVEGGTFVALGCPGGQKWNFKHGHVAYQIQGGDEHIRMQVKISS